MLATSASCFSNTQGFKVFADLSVHSDGADIVRSIEWLAKSQERCVGVVVLQSWIYPFLKYARISETFTSWHCIRCARMWHSLNAAHWDKTFGAKSTLFCKGAVLGFVFTSTRDAHLYPIHYVYSPYFHHKSLIFLRTCVIAA